MAKLPWFTSWGELFQTIWPIIAPLVSPVVWGLAQKFMGIPVDWAVLGALFVGTAFGVVWMFIFVWQKPAKFELKNSALSSQPSPPAEVLLEVPEQNDSQESKDRERDLRLRELKSTQEAAQEAANKEKIVVLVRVYANPTYRTAELVTQKLFGGLENSGDAKYQTIALLVRHCVLRSCHEAFQKLSLAVASADEETVEGLRQKLWDFLKAYQKLLCWTKHVAHNSFISLSGNAYKAWQENHRQFYKKLEELVASDDFFQLPKDLQEQWHDLES